MKIVKIFIIGLLISFAFGCAGKDQVYESIYEGLQSMKRIRNPDRSYPEDEEPMNYQQYKTEREKLLQEAPDR